MAVYAITLAFSNPQILAHSMKAFYQTRNLDLKIDSHIIVDQHYPLYREEVVKELKMQNLINGQTILDPGRNLGLHDGFNWALGQIKPKPEDIIIGYDADSMPVEKGWDMALVRAIEAKRSDGHGEVVWSSLGNPRTLRDLYARGFDSVKADGYLRLFLSRTAITNSVCAWRYGWLKEVGFLEEPRAFYGHLEAAMWGKLRAGKRWAVLPDWTESDELRDLHDRAYIVYKWRHSHLNDWPGDFESFVKAGCPESGSGAAPEVIP